jgi:amidase
MPISDYATYDGLGLAELVAKGDVTPSELVEEAIQRIERHNGSINAVVYKMYDQARARAAAMSSGNGNGALGGVPFLLKDILGDYQGVPTSQGSRYMAGMPAASDSTLVARFKAAGLVPLGKTNVPEYGLLPTTESAMYGPACNPWNTKHSTGGSSGGSAAAVAAGLVPIAHANDGGGSIRIPASCCGLVGIKPTRGRNPLGPSIGDIMSGLVAEGVVTRSVRDSAAVLDATHGSEPGDPYSAPPVVRPFLEEVATPPGKLRIAFTTSANEGRDLHPECARAVRETAKLCEELGHYVEEAIPPIDTAMMEDAFMTVWAAGLSMMIDAFSTIHGRAPGEDQLEGLTWGLYEQGKSISASQYLMAVAMIQILARQVGTFLTEYDCFLSPTLSSPPIRNGVVDIQERDPEKAFELLIDYVPYTPLQNATGQPAISLPLHWTKDGLPVGLMFAGRFGDEALLFRLAGQLEKARPWIDRKPPVWD